MATLDHAVTKVTVRQTTTSNVYTDIAGATIADSAFTVGRRYFVKVTCQMDGGGTTSNNISLRVLHGSTAFDDSDCSFEPQSASHRNPYVWFTVWTAVAAEGIKLQFKTDDATNTVIAGADQIVLSMWDAEPLLTAGDAYFDEDATSTPLTTSYAPGAGVTFTPALGSQDWLMLALARVSAPSTSQAIQTHLSVTGGATTTDPEMRLEGEDATNDRQVNVVIKPMTLDAAEYTLTEETKNTGGGGPRTHSKVLVFRLSAFAAYSVSYTAAQVDFTGTGTFGDTVAATTITQPIAGDVWSLSGFLYVPNGLGFSCNARMRIDGTDDPATQTSDAYALCTSADAADVSPIYFHTISTGLSPADYPLSLQASVPTATAGRGAKNRLAVMVSMALPDVGGGGGSGGGFFFRRARD